MAIESAQKHLEGLSHPQGSDPQKIAEELDPETAFRRPGRIGRWVIGIIAVSLSAFHLYTAGFGLLTEIVHRSTHLAAVMALIFLVFPRQKHCTAMRDWVASVGFAGFYIYLGWALVDEVFVDAGAPIPWWFVASIALIVLMTLPLPWFAKSDGGERAGIPWRDWMLAAIATSFSLYLIVMFDQVFIAHVGMPSGTDYAMGVIAMVMVIEASRRTMGLALPLVGIVFLLYAILGPYMPGILTHRGFPISRIVNHLYLGTEGIYGVAVAVVATYVFHFILFGVIAQVTGLGQLFIRLAMIVAGRFSGGPAKVSVVSSGLFGMISGSTVANTVTTGSLTIPLMKGIGFKRHFAGAVEASSSAGGQITPPIMGAAAFVLAETLGIPYLEVIAVAAIPAFFHYFALFLSVHFEGRRLGLSGMDRSAIPKAAAVLLAYWHLFIPLAVIIGLLLMRYTPFLAAFWGILACIAVSYIPMLARKAGWNGMSGETLTPVKLVKAFEEGAKFALGISAACAAVGFILGTVTLTGVGFKLSNAVLTVSEAMALFTDSVDIFGLLSVQGLVLFWSLVFTALACIFMGCGLPTVPLYVILSAIVAPALEQFGVPLLATHFAVFYFGLLSDVTPPMALAAFAAAGIAGSDPIRTSLTAFRLSMGKLLVPFMFVYAPALLFIDFSWPSFLIALASGLLAITALTAGFTGYFVRPLGVLSRAVLLVAGLCLVFNDMQVLFVAAAAVLTVLLTNAFGRAERRAQSGPVPEEASVER